MVELFKQRKEKVMKEHESLLTKTNQAVLPGNGIFVRYNNPVLTAGHVPLEWRYDFHESSNPYFMERIAVNSTFNSGAINGTANMCLWFG